MPLTIEDVFDACCASKNSTLSGLTREKLALAWDALLKWVVHQFDLLGQGASVPHFLRVTWRGSEYEAARSARGAPPSAASTSRAPTVQVHERRPHAALSEAFLERFALKARRVPDLPEARCEEVNFTKLALRYSEGLRKDEVAGALKRVVAKLGELLASGADVEVQLAHVARLFGRGRRVLVLFEPGFAPPGEAAAAQRDAARSRPATATGAGSRPATGAGSRPAAGAGARPATGAAGARPGTAQSGASAAGGAALRMLVRNGGGDARGSLRSNVPLPGEEEAAPGGGGQGARGGGAGPRDALRAPGAAGPRLGGSVRSGAGGAGRGGGRGAPGDAGEERGGAAARRGDGGRGARAARVYALRAVDEEEGEEGEGGWDDGELSPGARGRIARWLLDAAEPLPRPAARGGAPLRFPATPVYKDRPSSSAASITSTLRPKTADSRASSFTPSMAALAASAQRRFHEALHL